MFHLNKYKILYFNLNILKKMKKNIKIINNNQEIYITLLLMKNLLKNIKLNLMNVI